MKKTILAALGLALVSSAASVAVAADGYDRKGGAGANIKEVRVAESGSETNWSGLYVSGGVGGGVTTLGADNGQGGISMDGIKGDIRVGVDVARNGLLGGIFAQYGISDESLDFGGGGTVDQEDEWAVGARIGVTSGATLFYALGTYGQKSYSAGAFDETFDAWGLGLGIDHQVAKNFSLGLEYTHDWVDVSEYSDDAKVTDNAIKLRATYRLNGATFVDLK
jgi:opacity protein-like surface antigen